MDVILLVHLIFHMMIKNFHVDSTLIEDYWEISLVPFTQMHSYKSIDRILKSQLYA